MSLLSPHGIIAINFTACSAGIELDICAFVIGLQGMADDTPTMILLPGLTGGSHDSYVAYMAMAAAKAGIRPVVFNSRSTSDSPVTTGQFYSASFTDDMR